MKTNNSVLFILFSCLLLSIHSKRTWNFVYSAEMHLMNFSRNLSKWIDIWYSVSFNHFIIFDVKNKIVIFILFSVFLREIYKAMCEISHYIMMSATVFFIYIRRKKKNIFDGHFEHHELEKEILIFCLCYLQTCRWTSWISSSIISATVSFPKNKKINIFIRHCFH